MCQTKSVTHRDFKHLLTDLHPATQTEHQVQSRLLLDVVVAQGTPVLELLPRKDKTLLIRRNAFLVLDLGLDVVDGIARFDLKGDGLASDYRKLLAGCGDWVATDGRFRRVG